MKKTAGVGGLYVTVTHGERLGPHPEAHFLPCCMGFSVVSVLATALGDALHRLLGDEVFSWPLPSPGRTRNMEGAFSMGC